MLRRLTKLIRPSVKAAVSRQPVLQTIEKNTIRYSPVSSCFMNLQQQRCFATFAKSEITNENNDLRKQTDSTSETTKGKPLHVLEPKYLEKARVLDLSLVIERQGESFNYDQISILVDKILEKSPKQYQRGDVEKLISNLNKKRKLSVLKMSISNNHKPKLVNSYRTTDILAHLCMSTYDQELYPILKPSLEKVKAASSYNRGLYIRFLCTLGHLDDAIDDYAELTPDYLEHNHSVTSELFSGMYSGGYYNELINLIDYIKQHTKVSSIDGVNYARMVTELIKAKSKLGKLDEIQDLLDDAFQKNVLFLPLSYSDIITNIETSDVWKQKVQESTSNQSKQVIERSAIIEQYNCAVMALRKYKSHALTESSLLNAIIKIEDDKTCLMINAGALSVSIFKINVVDILGELTTYFSCTEKECEEKNVAIFPGMYLDEIYQMMKVLFPECKATVQANGSIFMNAGLICKYYKNCLLI